MKQLRLLSVLACCVGSVGAQSVQSDQQIFEVAGLLAEQGDYDRALAFYEKIESKGSTVHYNMAHCHYNQGAIERAVLHWLRADTQAGLFGDEQALHNINVVYQQLGYQPYVPTLTDSVRRAPDWLLQLIVFCLLALLLIARPRIGRNITMIACICLMVAAKLFSSFQVAHYVVCDDTAIVRTGPGSEYEQRYEVGRGRIIRSGARRKKVSILEEDLHADYVKIKTALGMGWVLKSAVERV